MAQNNSKVAVTKSVEIQTETSFEPLTDPVWESHYLLPQREQSSFRTEDVVD